MAQKKKADETPKGEANTPQVPNGVLVTIHDTPEGQTLNAQCVGETRVTEAPALLRLAAKRVEQQLGI